MQNGIFVLILLYHLKLNDAQVRAGLFSTYLRLNICRGHLPALTPAEIKTFSFYG